MTSVFDKVASYFLSDFDNKKSAHIFCQTLVGFTIVKLILLWSVSDLITTIQVQSPITSLLPRLLFWPSAWASQHHTVFYAGSLLILTATLFIRWNYISGALFFWICLNLTRLNFSIINGSDLIIIMLSFWAIGMSTTPAMKSERLLTLQRALFALSVLFCKLQVVGIYLVSGWDKVTDEVWRSGEAFAYIAHFDSLFNPIFSGLLESKGIQLLLSWMTILFELAFVMLVWFRKTRIPVLIAGVIFHLVIMFMLTLPDFGILMILSYLIFLKDSDHDRIKGFFKRPQL